MPAISCRAVLFDLDGVLVDSTPAVARVWTQWAKERGFNPEETVARAHGRPSLETLRELLPEADHQAENYELEHREMIDLEGVVALPGVLDLLRSLGPDQWTIVTSCTRPLAEVRVRAAGLPLPARMVTSSDIRRGKPHPEPFLKGAQILGAPVSQCLVVEDAPAGVRAGKAAGTRVLALTTTLPREELADAGADWIAEDCRELRVEENGEDLRLWLGRDLSTRTAGRSGV
ncbi:MAG TPA: HAD family hydrolase [Terriglobales bacterium]|jgi:sugar-phosphatase